jgi:hypothetical protein
VLRFSDARNFGRTATGIALIVGPLLFLISSIVQPNTDHKDKLRELAAVSAHKGTYFLSGVLFLVASAVLIYAAVGLIKLFRGPRGVTAGQVAGALLMLGSAVTFGWYALGAMEYEMVNQKGVNRAAMAQFLHKADSTSTLLPLIIAFLIGTVLGLIFLGIAAWRTGVVPKWTAILLILSGPFSFFSNGVAASIVQNVVLLIALGLLGWRVLSMSDEEWDSPRERAAPPPSEAPAVSAPAPAV